MRANTVMPLRLTSASSRSIVCLTAWLLGTVANPLSAIGMAPDRKLPPAGLYAESLADTIDRSGRIERRLFQLHGLEVRRQDDFENLAIAGIIEHHMLDARRLDPGAARPHQHFALPVDLGLDPALQHIDHLKIDGVV